MTLSSFQCTCDNLGNYIFTVINKYMILLVRHYDCCFSFTTKSTAYDFISTNLICLVYPLLFWFSLY